MPAQPESPPAESLAGHFGVRELRLPAKASELGRAREYANQAAATFGFGAEDRFEFVFAVNEAVTNAIMHGAADEAGTIGLRIVADDQRLLLDVCDRGHFLARPPVEEPLAEHGRGFPLMAKFVDDLEVRSGPEGTTVRLGKRRRADG